MRRKRRVKGSTDCRSKLDFSRPGITRGEADQVISSGEGVPGGSPGFQAVKILARHCPKHQGSKGGVVLQGQGAMLLGNGCHLAGEGAKGNVNLRLGKIKTRKRLAGAGLVLPEGGGREVNV